MAIPPLSHSTSAKRWTGYTLANKAAWQSASYPIPTFTQCPSLPFSHFKQIVSLQWYLPQSLLSVLHLRQDLISCLTLPYQKTSQSWRIAFRKSLPIVYSTMTPHSKCLAFELSSSKNLVEAEFIQIVYCIIIILSYLNCD